MIAITPKRIRKAFYTTLQQMEADRSLYVKDPLRDFTREGTFSFRRTMLFMTQMESHSTKGTQGTVPRADGWMALWCNSGQFYDWP